MDEENISHHCGHLPPWTIISSSEKLILVTKTKQKSEGYKLLLGYQLMRRNATVHRPDNVKLCRIIRLFTFHDKVKCSLKADPVKRRMYLFSPICARGHFLKITIEKVHFEEDITVTAGSPHFYTMSETVVGEMDKHGAGYSGNHFF